MARKIVFLSKGVDDASTRYRATQYISYLEAEEYEVENISVSGGVIAFTRGMKIVSEADIVIVIRKTFPMLQLAILRSLSKKLIFDFDDAVFCKSDGSRSHTRYVRFSAMVRKADAIFAGNAFLAKEATKHNRNVTLVPTSVDSQHYDSVSVNTANDYIDLVWIGSRSTSKYLKDILPVLDESYSTHPKLRLKVIADFNLENTSLPIESIQWSKENEVTELKKSQIGIAPMIDNTWTRGKCALKVLQYMASGLPVITVDVGVNGEALKKGSSGILVSDKNSWLVAIDKLYRDKALRKKMGHSGIEIVRENYDRKVVVKNILHVLKDLSH